MWYVRIRILSRNHWRISCGICVGDVSDLFFAFGEAILGLRIADL